MDTQQKSSTAEILAGLCIGYGDSGRKSGSIDLLLVEKKITNPNLWIAVKIICIIFQIHVVRPVLNRLNTLIETTASGKKGEFPTAN